MRVSKSSTDFFVPFFCVLVLATKLRLTNFPVGPGEIGLLLFVLICAKNFIAEPINSIKRCHLDIQLFWVVSGVSSLLGFLFFHKSTSMPYDIRGIIAFLFSIVLTLCFFQLHWSKYNSSKAFANLGALSCAVTAVYFLAHIILHKTFPEVFTYGSGVRFSGLSTNPNQLALALSFTPFASLLFFRRYVRNQTKGLKRYVFCGCFIITLTGGYFTGSSALLLSWFLGFLVLIVGYLSTKNDPEEIKSVRTFLILSILMSLILILIFREVFPLFYQTSSSQLANHIALETASVKIRWALLVNGILALHASPIVGFGPGAYSGIMVPFEGSEAHNSLLDWTLTCGLMGAVALLTLMIRLMQKLFVRGEVELISAFIAVGTFSQFHYVLRQPIVWFVIFLFVAIANFESRREISKCVE